MRDILPVIEVPTAILLLTPIFLVFFLGMVAWVYRKRSRPMYDRAGKLPLEDDD